MPLSVPDAASTADAALAPLRPLREVGTAVRVAFLALLGLPVAPVSSVPRHLEALPAPRSPSSPARFCAGGPLSPRGPVGAGLCVACLKQKVDQSWSIIDLHASVVSSSPTHWPAASLPSGYKHFRVLVQLPPPHVALHSVHSVQGPHEGQVCVLHSPSFMGSPSHPSSPSDLGRTHSRLWVVWPPPQLRVQGAHSVHSVQMGHGSVPHSCCSSPGPGQKRLPTARVATQARSLLWLPPPQVFVQGVHSVQSVQAGHLPVLLF